MQILKERKSLLVKILVSVLLVVTLTACAPAPPTTDIQSTAIAIVQTGVALTQTAMPTATPTFTPTATIVLPTFSPVPTAVRPIFTPDAIQLERWQEYQTELAKKNFYHEGYSSQLTCEWDILGHSNQEVYVWAFCGAPGGSGGGSPAVIYLNPDGSVQKVKTPSYWTESGKVVSTEDELFPADVIEKLDLYKGYSLLWGRPRELINHLNYRDSNPKEPPLVVLLATPITTPTP